MDDLNKYQLSNDGNFNKKFEDNSIDSEAEFKVYFRGIEQHLLTHIQRADAVFGAVAWLTSYRLLDALALVDHVSIVVQKEDFLRPDISSKSNFKETLKEKYSNLKCELDRYSFDNILSSVSVSSSPQIDPIRCVGNHNIDKKPAFPRMHNKFLVFANVEEDEGGFSSLYKISPYAVWTGSFNLTQNATMSLENALYLTNKKIVRAYFNEFGQIAAMSEPLDWTTSWIEPEWRIGT